MGTDSSENSGTTEKSHAQFYNTCTDNVGYHFVRINKSFKLFDHYSDDIIETSYFLKPDVEEFYLRFYLPKEKMIINNGDKERGGIDRIVIMINGLNEYGKNFTLYDLLGEKFAEENIASVLLPTAFHLNRETIFINRKDGQEIKETLRPSDDFINNPQHMYFHYKRTIIEIKDLIKRIRTDYIAEDFGFYKYHFDDEIKISILGYSLGGLIALSSFLFEEENTFDSCILFNSAPKLINAHVDDLNIHPVKWRELYTKLGEPSVVDAINRSNDGHSDYDALVKYFNILYRGDIPDFIKKRFENDVISKKMVIVMSGADAIVNTNQWDEILDTEEGIIDQKRLDGILLKYQDKFDGSYTKHIPDIELKSALRFEQKKLISQFTFAGVGHILTTEPYSLEVLPRIAQVMIDHILLCNTKHYQGKDVITRIYSLISRTRFFEDLYDLNITNKRIEKRFDIVSEEDKETKVINSFTKRQMTQLLEQLGEPNKQEEFKRLYYISKAYHPKFYDLLNVLAQKKYREEKDSTIKKDKEFNTKL